MHNVKRPIIVLSFVVSALVFGAWPMAALAATAPRIGNAVNFAVLGSSTVTNTGPTVVNGYLGVSPGSAVTGFPPGVVNGQLHKTDAVALAAQNSAVTAYNDLGSWGPTQNLTGQDLGGKSLIPGVYTFSSSAQLTGALTLRGNGIYIFQIGSTLTTASNSLVSLTQGAQGCGVYWRVGSSATLGTGTHLVGTIIAVASITMVTGATLLPGRAIARGGAVTLDSNQITVPSGNCTAVGITSVAPTGGGPTPTSPWSVLVLMAGTISLAGGVWYALRRRWHAAI